MKGGGRRGLRMTPGMVATHHFGVSSHPGPVAGKDTNQGRSSETPYSQRQRDLVKFLRTTRDANPCCGSRLRDCMARVGSFKRRYPFGGSDGTAGVPGGEIGLHLVEGRPGKILSGPKRQGIRGISAIFAPNGRNDQTENSPADYMAACVVHREPVSRR